MEAIKNFINKILNSGFWWLVPILGAIILCIVVVLVINTVNTTMPFVYDR